MTVATFPWMEPKPGSMGVPNPQYDVDLIRPDGTRAHTGDGAFYDCRVCHQGTFHFERADTVTGAFYHIVSTANKPQIAVFIAPSNVAGIIHAVVPGFVSQFGIPVIFFEQSDRLATGRVDHDLSLFAIFRTDCCR